MKIVPASSLLAAAILSAVMAAAEEASRPVTLGLFTSLTLTHNFNDPPDHDNALRVYDTREGELSLDVVEAVIQRKVATAGGVGFRLDLLAGSAIPHVTAANGLFRDPDTGEAEDIDLLQGFVSTIAPVGRGVRFDLGKFTALIGYEGVEGVDGWNDTISRSLLFYAEPTTHTGLRASTQLGDSVSAVAYLVNGCDVARDTNGSPSLGIQLGVARPGSPFSLTVNYLGGPEKPDNESDLRHTVDLIGKLVLAPGLSLGVELLTAAEEGSAPEGGEARWRGAALYLRTDPTTRFALTLRAETIDDPDGNRTGVGQRLFEATLAAQLNVGEGLFVRGEVRLDRSDADVFAGDGGARDRQPTLALNLVWTDSDLVNP